MMRTIIFDLSEVLVAGLVGVEKSLSKQLQLPEDMVLAAFGGRLLEDLCCGRLSEDAYLARIIEQQRWDVSIQPLKRLIRQNLHRRVPGMEDIVAHLAQEYELILLSDHVVEWVEYIRTIHPFLKVFRDQFFSFETGQTKGKASTFHKVLEAIGRKPQECLFIDDNPTNIRAATAVGITSIRFTGVEGLAVELGDLGIEV